MAIINAQHVQGALSGLLDNPNLTGDHWHFAWLNQFDPSPYASDSQRVGQSPLTTHWPVEANGREIEAQRLGAFLDDYYYRIHINPLQIDLGNVVSAQTTPIYLWNAWLEPRTLTDIAGIDEGILVSGQPSPPLLFPALKELEWQLTVTPDGQPVLDTIVEWQFDNGRNASIRVTANRIIGWTFAPDWGDGVSERLISATDIMQSESAVEQRRALRPAPRREFQAPMYVEGRERQLLDLSLFGWGSRVWAMPLWHEIQLLDVPVPAEAMAITCSTAYLDFHAGGLAMLLGESAFVSETVEILSVSPTGLQLKRATQQSWPAGTRLYPVRSAQLSREPELTRLTDQLISADVRFLVVEPSDWPAVMPATLYRGRPVYAARPDESKDLTSSFSRLTTKLDNGSAMPLFTDVANRPLSLCGHRWIDLGRAQRAALRSFIYAMNGRQAAVWVPTHADDVTLLDVVTDTGTTLDVANIGYTRFASAKPGRRDIRIELHDGTVFHRRITGSTELGLDVERLVIDSAFGRQVEVNDVARISWMTLCRLNSDTVEIEHETDSEGVASCAFVFKEVRDDEFQ
ncbi:hypothetical protein [Phytopseudomonas daroniae]|uniref:hypothetical protein n=1 Tax=Phytopseudomonas daroniae TaxID=2487519 RepID=UPI001038446E|nr:hypothetical protein [Pseudomonas daroniae]TBU75191.1 hypothetical protein DNK10_11075 [Pseudomonas daroniae]